ncbi:MFS transporter [Novosphingobium mathurense]|uniref:MFS transporter, AAHS family, 4-hydroxybenzoate transporter n=1 Tax=Novosphingobium mathurense TaxID=428990 RepID=A0A1U6HVZ9_9SPHN|nr:MFS transporter [Novosphingobium mathurense]SLJ99915.1 MFS transporter, AAHS family, 4-hydroxybenzoate transporter [Novosphingobium mathurense]
MTGPVFLLAMPAGVLGRFPSAGLLAGEVYRVILGKFHGVQLILGCAMALFAGGFAFQTLSFSMPGLVRDWNLPEGLIGPLLSAAIFGLLLGYLFMAPLADRLGPRAVVCPAMLGLAASAGICLLAPNVEVLILGRVLIGIAIGAAFPCAVSAASQHGMQRWRGAKVVGIYVAYSFGFLAAGLASGWLVPLHGWRAAWGLTLPAALIAAGLLWDALPARLPHAPQSRPLASLFTSDLRQGTLLFWLMCSIGLGLFYAVQGWLPLLSAREGMNYANAVTAANLFTVGNAVGAVPMIWWADRMGPFRALVCVSAIGLAGIVLLGLSTGEGGRLFLLAAVLAGIGIGGGQKGMIAAASQFYPPRLRSTGIGWALGLGRFGALCGPLLIGFVTMHDVAGGTALLSLAFPVPVIMLAAFWLDRTYGRIDRATDNQSPRHAMPNDQVRR